MNINALIKRRVLVIAAILLAILVMSLIIYFFPLFPSENSQQGSVLKLVLNQETSGKISISQMEVKEGYPADYKIRYRDNYLTVQIVSEKDKSLFMGTFLTKTFSIHETMIDGKLTGMASEIIFPKISLYLPYFPIAKTIVILDKSNNEILRQDIDHSTLDTTSGNRHRCGNGICDQNENLISCFQDCRHY